MVVKKLMSSEKGLRNFKLELESSKITGSLEKNKLTGYGFLIV